MEACKLLYTFHFAIVTNSYVSRLFQQNLFSRKKAGEKWGETSINEAVGPRDSPG